MDLPNRPVPLKSTFASDPDMAELVSEFAAEMPEKARELSALWDSQKLDELSRLAHQLKGASAGYGFEVLGLSAGRLEAGLKCAERDLESIRASLDELVALCGRVSA
ncbi:MAG: Hpt domain-containing protein [Planctomycetes bacterium]|nr:Hpt domain-containing protein [Planctomycetota bacterium]